MARRNLPYPAGARARSIPVFHVDIRLYAIGWTAGRQTCIGHEKVMEITTVGLAQARPNYTTSFGSPLLVLTTVSPGCSRGDAEAAIVINCCVQLYDVHVALVSSRSSVS